MPRGTPHKEAEHRGLSKNTQFMLLVYAHSDVTDDDIYWDKIAEKMGYQDAQEAKSRFAALLEKYKPKEVQPPEDNEDVVEFADGTEILQITPRILGPRKPKAPKPQ